MKAAVGNPRDRPRVVWHSMETTPAHFNVWEGEGYLMIGGRQGSPYLGFGLPEGRWVHLLRQD